MSTIAKPISSIAGGRSRGGGGINKRRSQGRQDADGDSSMGGQPPSGPKGARGGRGGQNHHRGPRKPMSGSGVGTVSSRTRSKEPQTYVKGTAASAGLIEIRVTGWKESKSNAQECVIFLERKAGIKFRRTRIAGDVLNLQVPLAKAVSFLDWNGVAFASSHLKIEALNLPSSIQISNQPQPEHSEGAKQAANLLQEVLRTRYLVDSKMLNLASLIQDPILQSSGFFNSTSTHTKLFPALMKVADQQFKSSADKREKVHSISLESNTLSDINLVTTLAVTFPHLKNLSLANNDIKTWKDLDAWRWKFRQLEQLVLQGNPIAQDPQYREEARRRYPTLIMLDMQVYPEKPVTVAAKKEDVSGLPAAPMIPLPLPVKGGHLMEQDIVASFLAKFFPLYDTDRNNCLRVFYDENSTFSLSVNTSAPRNPHTNVTLQKWDNYIHKSRNLTRLTNPGAMTNRLFAGHAAIAKCWANLPVSKHDSQNASKWTFDAWPVPVDQVSGLWIVVHGELEEPENVKNNVAPLRSFDRTFIILPRSDGQGIRVVNDILVLRAWGGSAAWVPDSDAPKQAPVPQQQPSAPVQQTVVPAIAAPLPIIAGKPAQTALPVQAAQPIQQGAIVAPQQPAGEPSSEIKAQMIAELRRRSGLTVEFATMCLSETGWNFDNAWKAFETVKANGQLPPNAYA